MEGKAISRNNKISEELTPDDEMTHMKFAHMTSVDVKRNFSRYKTILSSTWLYSAVMKTQGKNIKNILI